MQQKIQSPVGVTAEVVGFGFLVAAAAMPDGYGKYLALGAWAALEVVALLAFRRARRVDRDDREGWPLRDGYLIALGMAALVVAVVFGSAFDGSVGSGAVFVLAAAVTSWVYLPRVRGHRAVGRL